MNFDQQLNNLLEKNYPKLADLAEPDFLSLIEPLRKAANNIVGDEDYKEGHLPFVIVVSDALIPAEKMMSVVNRNGVAGVTVLRPHASGNFHTVQDVALPSAKAYLLVGIDRGKDNINLPPNEAMTLIKKANRSPLTIAEGIAIITQYPDFLMKNNCFSLLASRTGADQRVPAIWINSKKEPNLGWCWDGNPHTWLGSASCKDRILG